MASLDSLPYPQLVLALFADRGSVEVTVKQCYGEIWLDTEHRIPFGGRDRGRHIAVYRSVLL